MLFKFGNKLNVKSLIAIVCSDQAHAEIAAIDFKSADLDAKIKKTDDIFRDGKSLVNGSADVVIVEADLTDSRSDALLRNLCHYVSQDGAMIVISSNPTAQQMRQLFKMGINDVLSLPLSETDVFNSIQGAIDEQSKRSTGAKPGKVISVIKCGGGAGATTLTANLAHQFMTSSNIKKGGVAKKSSVAVFDFNVQFGTLALSLDVKARTSILDAMQAETRLDADLLASTMQTHESGLRILPSPEDIVPLTAFDSKLFENLIGLGRSMYDYTFIDMPQAWTKWTHAVLSRSDMILIVMCPTVEHTNNGLKLTKGLNHLDIDPEKLLVVINKVGKGMSVKERVSQIEKTTKKSTVVVRNDDALHKTARDRGKLIAKLHGSGATIKDFNLVCSKIWQQITRIESQAVSLANQQNTHGQDEMRI